MDFSTAQQRFYDHLVSERGLAKNSVVAYGRDITKFGNFLLSSGTRFEGVNEADVSAFEALLRQEKLSQSSINRVLSGVRAFYKYLNRDYLVVNPTSHLTTGKIALRLPKALTVAEMIALIESTDRPENPLSLRDHAILELLYSSGARVSEIVGINVGDFSFSHTNEGEITSLKLTGKGSKERIVPLGRYAKAAIENYLVRTRPALDEKVEPKKRSGALFLNSRGSRLSRQSAWQIVSDAADATGLRGKVSPHVFRHSYATHLLDGGADIRVVQELLGHSSVTTTQIYTLITIDKVRESYSTAHPRAH